MSYEREYQEDPIQGPTITPMGMSRSHGQQHQSAKARPGATRRPNPQVQQAIVGGGQWQTPGQPGPALNAQGPQSTTPRDQQSPNGLPASYGAQGPQSGVGQAIMGGNGIDARKALGGYAPVGNMMGFNTAMNYPDDKAANSLKNTIGRIASRYSNDATGIQQLMQDPDFQRYAPGATYDGIDKINFGGLLSDFESGVPVYEVDMLGAYDKATGQAQGWTWQDIINDQQGQQAMMSPMLSNDIYAQAQQSIMDPTSGMQAPMDENALMLLYEQLLAQSQGGQQDPNFQNFLGF
jgi:hypothetical protein